MIPLIRPYIDLSQVENAFADIFQSGILSKGKYIALLEEQFAHFLNCQYAFSTSSATTALSTSLAVLDIGPGDEVIIADFSFPATANVVENCGATPIFADVDLNTFNLQPEELDKKHTAKTKAVIFVDCFGNPTGFNDVKQWCQQNDVWLIEDAACAIGSSENGQLCGAFADLSCFSFHPRKLLTAGEGGMITTNHPAFAKRLKTLLSHGANGSKNGITLDFTEAGFNYRMSELQAAMILAQLPRTREIIYQRNQVRDCYIRELSAVGFIPQTIGSNVTFNCQSVVFKIPHSIDRNHFIHQLRIQQVEATIGTYCLSATRYYQQKYNQLQPNARQLQNQTITLPCFEKVPIDQIIQVIQDIILLYNRSKGV